MDEHIRQAIIDQIVEAEKLILLYDFNRIGLRWCHYCFESYDPANGHTCEEQ